jgi:hypothetical protein
MARERILITVRNSDCNWHERRLPDFRLADIERACPGVGREWIRTLLAGMKAAGEVSCQGKGPASRWRHLGSKGIKS